MDPKYNDKVYDTNVEKVVKSVDDALKAAQDQGTLETYATRWNIFLEQCIITAGLNREDLPQ